jgi:hypothetical protein
MSVIYSSEIEYVQEAQDLRDKIKRVDKIINKLFDAGLNAAANQDISSYSLDDGQTSINTSYRTAEECLKAAKQFESFKESYINKLNGHFISLKPISNNRRGI